MIAASLWLLGGHYALAQTPPPPAGPPAAAVDAKPKAERPAPKQAPQPMDRNVEREATDLIKQFTEPAEILSQLEKPTREISEAMANINKLLESNIDVIRNADAEFDRMIGAVEDAASTGKPDSLLMKNLDQLIEAAEKEAQDARNRGDSNFQKIFEKYSTDFAAAKIKASEIQSSSYGIIRELKSEKARFAQGIKLKQFELARKNVQNGLELLSKVQSGLSNVRGAVPAWNGASQ